MQNRNMYIAIAAVVIVGIVVATAVIRQVPPSPENEVQSTSQQDILYTNQELGFQIQFPAIWEGKYKAVKDANSISFLLPTNDSDWQNSNLIFPGYVELFGINVWTIIEWEAAMAECRLDSAPAACEAALIGTNSQYAFTWFHPQDQPTDFAQFNFGGIEYLRKNFKALK